MELQSQQGEKTHLWFAAVLHLYYRMRMWVDLAFFTESFVGSGLCWLVFEPVSNLITAAIKPE